METWYKVRFDKIEPVEVVRHTAKFVIFPKDEFWNKERKEAKRSDWSNYFETWEEAYDYALTKAQAKVDSLRLQLQKANGTLGNIKGMKPPSS